MSIKKWASARMSGKAEEDPRLDLVFGKNALSVAQQYNVKSDMSGDEANSIMKKLAQAKRRLQTPPMDSSRAAAQMIKDIDNVMWGKIDRAARKLLPGQMHHGDESREGPPHPSQVKKT